MTFKLLEIKPEIIRALEEDGIIKPTKIQKLAIPVIKSGQDVIGISNTGSGKTVAFGVPILEKIVPKSGLQVLIMCPTRELAVQIAKELKKFSKYFPCNITTVYGGVGLGQQAFNLTKADIVVGTTGRLVDHFQRGNLNLSKLRCVVLDEADKMVEMGFIEDIELLLKHVPKDKQVLLFGATISDEVNNIKHRHMNQPKIVKAEAYVKEDYLKQYYYDVEPKEKFSLLVHLLKKEQTKRVLIFCSTRIGVEILARNLRFQGIKVDMMHGKLSQSARLRIIDDFNSGISKILVASAVAARGLDIRDISHVFNFDLSNDPLEYVHRIGRTARAGESGKAITLLEPRNHDVFGQILQNYDLKVEKLEAGDFPKLRFQARSMQSRGRFNPRHSHSHRDNSRNRYRRHSSY